MRTRAWREVRISGSLNPSLGPETRVKCMWQPTERMGQRPKERGIEMGEDRDGRGRNIKMRKQRSRERGTEKGAPGGLSRDLPLTYKPSLGE